MACTSVNVVATWKVVEMGKQALRQQARQEVRQTRMRRAAELRDWEKQCTALAEAVLVARGERDEAEVRAGRSLLTLTSDQGLTLASAVQWCEDGLTFQEAKRLRRLALAAGEHEPQQPGEHESKEEGEPEHRRAVLAAREQDDPSAGEGRPVPSPPFSQPSPSVRLGCLWTSVSSGKAAGHAGIEGRRQLEGVPR